MQKFIGGALALIILASCGKQDAGKPETAYDFSKDAYIWLEDVEGEEALAWVEEQNAVSLGHLEALPVFAPLKERNLEIYNSDERIATPAMRGDHVYNFWRDEDNIRGRWRRMLLDDYIEGSEEWELVLDIDLLAEGEDEDWVWKGAQCLRPEYRRCLLNLSRGGADAVVVREFDVETKTFVMDGFSIPEAKQRISWVDENAVWVGSDFGDGSTTDSGYPRTSRLWKRGEPLEEAAEIFAGEQADVAAGVYRSWDRDDSYDVAYRVPSFFETLNYLYTGDGEFRHIDIPADADLVGVMNGQLLVQLKTDWEIAETTYPQAALMSIDFGRFMDGDRDFEVLIVPGESMAIPRGGIITTRDYIIVRLLDDVVSKLQRFSFADGRWVSEEIEAEDLGSVTLGSSSDESNIFFFTYEDFLTPDTLYVADDGGRTVKALRSLPEFFDSEGMTAEQHFATSKDGTRVPYFVVLPKGFEPDGTTPTLMYGYGGFEVSRPPSYSATVGHSWLERGGAFVVANIRGGGEYGPAWHHAALKENRQRAYDDFIAVGEDLIARGITSPGHLGIRGGSNGGLLTGVMLTQRPDLWGGVVIQVPLLDMKRYNKLLAGASWMGEYGDPDTDDWEFIKEYSPYHNLDPDADYPTPFITTSTRDDRVHPGHARKMVARLKEMGHDLLYYENTVGGHAGASDNEQLARAEALIYSYLWDQLTEPAAE
ncbi:MAG: prolyl oligopeptidase family serine peptidase [Gammaproteobacteria bacterium]|nr:prolyl oligopeptidase family serine peptidase [Gammaproteobacteria bacterium]MDH4003775.1 prolyl oligopeptidase family serine peptidase [Gammaproteobacteria bacterium]